MIVNKSNYVPWQADVSYVLPGVSYCPIAPCVASFCHRVFVLFLSQRLQSDGLGQSLGSFSEWFYEYGYTGTMYVSLEAS